MSDTISDTHFCAVLDIAGTEKLIGPPEKLAKKLLHAARALGLHAAIVVSTNIDAALNEAKEAYATSAVKRGLRIIIAGAGGAAHLPGVTAAFTTLPVIGVPIESKS